MLTSLRRDVMALARPEGRVVGSPGHEAARRYLLGRLAELGLEGYRGGRFELPYSAGGQRFVNLVGRLPGTRPDLAPVLLGAHYDTCGRQPGADDNAAAVAILLACAARLEVERPLLLALFDAEEPPYFHTSSMGSTVFYLEQRQEHIHAAVVLDLVGHDVPVPGLEDLLFITGMESDPKLPEVLKGCEGIPGLRLVAALNRYVGDMSDHHVFRMHARPYLFLTCGRWPHYHMPSDTPERLNYEKMEAVAQCLLKLVPRLRDAGLEGPFEGYDSTPHELYFIRKALGPMAARFGLSLESRQDIDRLAALFLSQFRL